MVGPALIDGPQYVEQVDAADIAAGADVITSNEALTLCHHRDRRRNRHTDGSGSAGALTRLRPAFLAR